MKKIICCRSLLAVLIAVEVVVGQPPMFAQYKQGVFLAMLKADQPVSLTEKDDRMKLESIRLNFDRTRTR
jgi:hypothetical protein